MDIYHYLQNLLPSDKMVAQEKKIKNKIPARLYIYFPYGEIYNKKHDRFPILNNSDFLKNVSVK